MASRRLEEISKRAMFLNLFVFFSYTCSLLLFHTRTKKQPPTPIHLIHTTHTPGVCVTRLFISQLNDFFLVLPFHVREMLLRVFDYFFFFHADSLTRLSSVEKRKIPASFQNGGRKGDETQQVIQNAFIHRYDKHSEASPSCCLSFTRLSLPSADIASQSNETNQIDTTDDLRPGLDYFSFVT